MLMHETAPDVVVSGLVGELARAWDGLDALAKIIAARGGTDGGGPVLHRLLETACIARPEVCSAVWKTEGDVLILVAQFGGVAIDPTALALAEACARSGRTRILNADGAPHAESTGQDSRVIATPGRAPSGRRAVLAFWSPADTAPFDSHTVRIAEALALQVALIFEEEDWTRRLLNQERADADLAAARRIQASLLESPRVGESGPVSWASFSRPSRVVGGDFHDVNARPGTGVDVVVGDVMGKGLPAALLGAACLNHVLRAASTSGPSARLGQILSRANDTLTPELVRLETFASMILVRVDGEPLRLTVADAGHASLLIRSGDGGVFKPRGRETLLGVEREPFGETSVALSPGDLILVFTDGLTDIARKNRRPFDVAGWLADTRAVTPSEVVSELSATLETFCPAGDAPEDDITFVAIGIGDR
jgi:serine phosphatase RsbU (regulator of sigma subunit)